MKQYAEMTMILGHTESLSQDFCDKLTREYKTEQQRLERLSQLKHGEMTRSLVIVFFNKHHLSAIV